MSETQKTFGFLVGYLVFIVLMIVWSKTRLGYVIIYYALALIIFGILLTQYKAIGSLLNGIGSGSLSSLNKQPYQSGN